MYGMVTVNSVSFQYIMVKVHVKGLYGVFTVGIYDGWWTKYSPVMST